MKRASLLLCALAVTAARAEQTILFVDDAEVFYRSGTKRVVHPLQKFADNPVVFPTEKWDSWIAFCSAGRQPQTGKFQLWYQAYSGKSNTDKRLKSVVAYAESADGKQWTKPRLDLFPYYDEKQTNIVLTGNADGYGDRYGASVLIDTHEADPARRYKLAHYDWKGGPGAQGGAGLFLAASPDGIHWTKDPGGLALPTAFGHKAQPVPFAGESTYSEGAATATKPLRRTWNLPLTMSDAFDLMYDTRLGVYALYGKMWIDGPDGAAGWKHAMGRSESSDARHWSRPELILTQSDRDPDNLEFHTSPVFMERGVYFSLNQLFDRAGGTIDTELMTSRDGRRWERNFSDIRILARGKGSVFDSGSLFTNATPLVVGDELWFYYGAYRGLTPGKAAGVSAHPEARSGIGLATIQRDRLAGLAPDSEAPVRNTKKATKPKPGATPAPVRISAPNAIAQITLKPRSLADVRELLINADATNGAVRVEILTAGGYRLHGFTKEEAVPLHGDNLRHHAAWQEKSLRDLPPGQYLIRLHLQNAEVFSCALE